MDGNYAPPIVARFAHSTTIGSAPLPKLSWALCVNQIMINAINIISSTDKKNIRFVAAGSYQIEFFEYEDGKYFTIYRFNYGGEDQAHYYLINLKTSGIAQVSYAEFQVIQGSSTYKLSIIEKSNKNTVYLTRYLWGWLPLSRFGGKVSKTGLSALRSNLEKYANDLAA